MWFLTMFSFEEEKCFPFKFVWYNLVRVPLKEHLYISYILRSFIYIYFHLFFFFVNYMMFYLRNVYSKCAMCYMNVTEVLKG